VEFSGTLASRGQEELFFPVVLLCQFLVLAGNRILVLHTYVCYLTIFLGFNIFLIVVEVLRYFVRQFRYFHTNFLVESEFSFPT
jgi:hypothetical protein